MPKNPIQNQLRTPLGRALHDAGMVNWEEEQQVQQGKFYGWTTTGQNGLGVGVYARGATDKVVSLFNIRTDEEDKVKFATRLHIDDYLPDIPSEALDSWMDFIETLEPVPRTISDQQYLVVQLSRVEENVDRMIELMKPLYRTMDSK